MTVVLLSGGLDSTTALARTLQADPDGDVVALTADYGQRHRAELSAARAVCDHYLLPHRPIHLRALLRQTASALTDPDIDVPEGHYSDDTMKATVVPGRNLLFLAAAATYAENHGHDAIVIGVHAGDHPVYPDCRPEFVHAADQVVRASTGGKVSVSAPFVDLSKAAVVAEGIALGAPLHLTWSCYKGGPVQHCGRCGTCVERAEAFHVAGASDPTLYEDTSFWIGATGSTA